MRFNQQQLKKIVTEIDTAAEMSGRKHGSVILLAVSKTRSTAEIRAAAGYSIRNFGENYLQEALPKIVKLSGLELCWHFIGAVQSNKTRDICRNFQWLHTLDRVKIAARLSSQRQELYPQQPLNVCIQVNIDREPQKAGIPAEELMDFLRQVVPCEGIRLRGLMAIGKPRKRPEERRESFHALSLLFEEAAPVAGPHWDTLSMGMSADFTEAILEGATLVRLGTALFGPRIAAKR